MTSPSSWPESVPLVSRNRYRLYQTPEGEFPGVTSVLKVLGLATEGLIKWSANEERKAVLEAAGDVFAEGKHEDGPAGFLAEVENRLGKARAHQKQVAKAADIGTSAHLAVQRQMREELGQPVGPPEILPDPSLWAYMAFQDFWHASGLKALRSEQVVWSPVGYAGTVDIVALDPEKGPGIIDIKTSKGVYTDHHLQVAAYCHAARNWSEINWAKLVRLPKNTDDPGFEVVPLGHLYGGVRKSEEDLFRAFAAALEAWRILLKGD